MRSVFGWDLPPGCTQRHIDEACGTEGPCDVCGLSASDCVCPECPVCNVQGDPSCYPSLGIGQHGLRLGKAQAINRQKRKIAELQERIHEEGQYLAWLQEQPENFDFDDAVPF